MAPPLTIMLGGGAGTKGAARLVGPNSALGAAIGPAVEVDSLEIDQVVSRRGSTAKLRLIDVGNQITVGRYSPIRISDDQNNTLFKGWVALTHYEVPSPNERTIDLTCVDATVFLTSRLHNKVYQNAYVTDIARDMVLNANPPVGITANNTPPGQGYLIPYFRISHGAIATELTRLAKLASVGLVWDWYLDWNADLHFFYADQAPLSAVVLTDQEPPLPPGWYWYDRDSFTYEVDDTQLGTQVTVRGGTYLSNPYLQTWVGNGQQTSFPLDYPPDIQGAGLPTVTVGGVSQTVAQGQQGVTPTTQWVVSQAVDSNTWVLSVGTASAPGSGVVIQASYQFDLPVLVKAKNNDQVAALTNLPNQGFFDRYVADTTLVSSPAAHARALAELGAYAQSYINVHVEVQDVATGAGGIGTLIAGQKLRLINSQLGVDTTLLVVKNAIKGTHANFYRYCLDLQG